MKKRHRSSIYDPHREDIEKWCGQGITVKEMAERLQITPAAITVALSKLERDGLISRKTGADSRYNEIEITEKGKEIVERSKNHFAKVDREAFQGIDESELLVFEKCLDKMYSNLSAFLGKDKI